jgi:histidinol dehydrogenase
MKVYHNPDVNTWKELLQRPQIELGFLDSAVRNILNRVKKSGDSAVRELTQQFDKVTLDNLKVTDEEVQQSVKSISPTLSEAIQTAARNIEKFHAAQRREVMTMETMPGVKCWRKAVPITKVGIYIPGGSAPLFSTVLMLGVPARLAGCAEVVLCTPPDKTEKINPAILFTANLVGIKQIFKVGGAQAIAALAYGTETIPAVYKIFGPGNQYVTKAKQLVTEDGIAIDMPAGPSEVLVIADETANPKFIAADLLSQAEHGEDSQVTLVLLNESILTSVQNEIHTQLNALPRKNIAEKALASSNVILFNSVETATDFVNAYAPEHLIVNLKNASAFSENVVNAGSVFLGNFSPEAIGDYAAGTNHTLPTNGYAKAYAGVSLESFTKYITFQQLSEDGIKTLGPFVTELAEAEQLIGHKVAVQVRLDALKSKP